MQFSKGYLIKSRWNWNNKYAAKYPVIELHPKSDIFCLHLAITYNLTLPATPIQLIKTNFSDVERSMLAARKKKH